MSIDKNYIKSVDDLELAEMTEVRIDLLKKEIIWHSTVDVLEELLRRFRYNSTKYKLTY